MRPLLIKNARLVDPATGRDFSGALLAVGGAIADVSAGAAPGAPDGAEIVDAEGLVLAPGLIDARVFVGEPGAEHKETLESASAAASAGGITTIVMMPNTEPVIDDAALVDFIARRARDTAIVRVLPMAALTKGTEGQVMSEMGLLKEAGAIAFTDGDRSVSSARVMRRAMAYSTLFDALIVHHTEEPALSEGTVMNEGELATRLGLSGVPKAAETMMLERDMALVRLTGARYMAASVTCPEAIAIVARAKDEGLKVSAAAAAHHLLLNENDIGPYRTFLKVRPPLRAEDDRAALVAALADGAIDLVVSSHRPQGPEDKRLPFAEAADGAAGLETLLPVLLQLVARGDVTLLEALAPVTSNPARHLGLTAGRLAKGAPADLVLIDPNAAFRLRLQDLRSRGRNSPFEGHRFDGRAVRTIVGGRTVFGP